jgi:transcriptional regulator with XRE-family HTH domain
MKAPVGVRVWQARRARGLTQEDLAHKARINAITISRLEKASAKAVYADTVAALATALGVSADYLLGLAEHETGHLPTRESEADLPRES